jgi:hypothetical protein
LLESRAAAAALELHVDLVSGEILKSELED